MTLDGAPRSACGPGRRAGAALCVLIPLLVAVLAGCSGPHPTNTNHAPASKQRAEKFSGKATVEGLGLVAFPPGQWRLEFQGRDKSENYSWGDYFVFRRTGLPLHRLTVFRVPPGRAAPALYMYLDTLHETMADGIPILQRWPKLDVVESGFPLRLDPPDGASTNEIDISFTSKTQSGTSWLTHACLSRPYHGWTFILVYTSTEVTSPELVEDVRLFSRLARMTLAVRKPDDAPSVLPSASLHR
jgi:hypothetical protein